MEDLDYIQDPKFPEPEVDLKIYTEDSTVTGFFDGMYFYDQKGYMLPVIQRWEYLND